MTDQQVTIAEASDLVSKSPKTLYALIKNGKLSATSNAQGQKMIAVSELLRVYGSISKPAELPQEPANNELQELKHKLELQALEINNLKQRLDDKERNLEDLRQATKLLEHQQSKNKSFLGKLFS